MKLTMEKKRILECSLNQMDADEEQEQYEQLLSKDSEVEIVDCHN